MITWDLPLGWFNIHKSVNVIHRIHNMNKKNHTFSLDTEKARDRIQHPFMTKSLNKLSMEKAPNIIKETRDKPTADSGPDGGRRGASPLRSGTRQGAPPTAPTQRNTVVRASRCPTTHKATVNKTHSAGMNTGSRGPAPEGRAQGPAHARAHGFLLD